MTLEQLRVLVAVVAPVAEFRDLIPLGGSPGFNRAATAYLLTTIDDAIADQ